MHRTGKFITIEGIEGAGKSTVLQFVKQWLKTHANVSVALTREPGGTPIAEKIRALLLSRAHQVSMAPMTELLLIFAARAEHIQAFIKPALQQGQWVVSDRYIDASYAYQCGGRALDEATIKILDQLVVGSLYPDLTLLLDIGAKQGLERASNRGDKDRIEVEPEVFFNHVRDYYLKRADDARERIKVINARQSQDLVEDEVRRVLERFVSRQS